MRIVISGVAGLVGQNLVPRLKARGFTSIVGIDKHPANTATLRQLHPDITVVEADLAEPGEWTAALQGCDVLIHNHAQVVGLRSDAYQRNNIVASERVLAAAAAHRVPYMIHISSSVVNSLARDIYSESKTAQEKLAVESGIPCCVLRPTLMFGWFDRKHLAWLARFMNTVPVFPIPGDGRYIRQPLYAADFCNVIASAIEQPRPGHTYNITGQTRIDYIDLIREVKKASGGRAIIARIPYGLFRLLLQTYAQFDSNPPFTARQLEALVIPELFEVIDWPAAFGVKSTPLADAIKDTFQHPVYSKVVLEF